MIRVISISTSMSISRATLMRHYNPAAPERQNGPRFPLPLKPRAVDVCTKLALPRVSLVVRI